MAENKTTIEDENTCDVLIIGAGAAGLSLALKIASNTKVRVLSKNWQLHEEKAWGSYTLVNSWIKHGELSSLSPHTLLDTHTHAGLQEQVVI